MVKNRLAKKVTIARSGVQQYLRREIESMKVAIPDSEKSRRVFGVYRSAPLLASNKDKFTKQPLIYTHKGYVNPANFTKFAQGWVGDSAEVEINDAKTEALITGDLNILGQEAMEAYDSGEREVSPHYFGVFDWEPGVAPDGTPYDVVMKEITEVNHLALVPKGRGGREVAIQDHGMGGLSGVWDFIARKLGMVGVNDHDVQFRAVLTEIAALRSTLDETELRTKAAPLYDLVCNLPSGGDTDLLYRYLGDISLLPEETDEAANEYVKIVADLFEKIEKTGIIETMDKQESQVNAEAKDAEAVMSEDKKDEKKDDDKGLSEFMAKVKDHLAGGGKVSDYGLIEAKKEDEKKPEAEDEEPEKKKEKEKKDEKSEAKDEEKEEKEDEKKAGAEDRASVYDASPFNVLFASRPAPSRAGDAFLRKSGYLPKEKK